MGQHLALSSRVSEIPFGVYPIIKSKIDRDPSFSGFTQEERNAVARRLSNPRKVRKHYLRTNFVSTTPRSPRSLLSPRSVALHIRTNSNLFSTLSTNTINTTSSSLLSEATDLDEPLEHVIKIKLLVSEVYNDAPMKAVRRIVSPIMAGTTQLPEFGMFHSSVLIGPWKLEWINSSLCIPRRCTSEKAVIAVDICTVEGKDKIIALADKLADFIVRINATFEYANLRSETKINCQDFVDLLFQEFNFQPSFGKPVQNYLQRLRKKGTAGMIFEYDDSFRDRFKLKGNKRKFKTHCQLDEFVIHIENVDPMFSSNWPHEYELLKSFDRAMWIRALAVERYKHNMSFRSYQTDLTEEEKEKIQLELIKLESDKKHKVYQPLKTIHTDEEGVGTLEEVYCPFGDPLISSSYAMNFRYFDA